MTVLYRNPCYNEGSYNEVDLYQVSSKSVHLFHGSMEEDF